MFFIHIFFIFENNFTLTIKKYSEPNHRSYELLYILCKRNMNTSYIMCSQFKYSNKLFCGGFSIEEQSFCALVFTFMRTIDLILEFKPRILTLDQKLYSFQFCIQQNFDCFPEKCKYCIYSIQYSVFHNNLNFKKIFFSN